MKTYKTTTLFLGLLTSLLGFTQNSNFSELERDFLNRYPALNIPNLQISYVATLEGVSDSKHLKKQEQFFKEFKEKLKKVDISELSGTQKINFQILNYETRLNLERIELEKQWKKVPLDDSKSLITVPNGKKWYAYLLKKWVDKDVTPDEMFQFGLIEINKVKSSMERLKNTSGLSLSDFETYLNNELFFIKNPDEVKNEFEKIKNEVKISANKLFPYIKTIPDVGIEKGTNAELSHVPAFYNNRTFYFNFFDEPFNKRQLGWIYIHEAIPGHHYQFMVNNIVNRTEIQNLFWYPSFSEGWGAYVEHLGDELGVYKTIYDEYGKWEWDLIRSVRVSLDVAINYYGWSDEKALKFWKKYIKDQDDIALREIARMKRWPAQVITYKYGANKFLDLLNIAKQKDTFSYKNFHSGLLKHGDIPLSLLDN